VSVELETLLRPDKQHHPETIQSAELADRLRSHLNTPVMLRAMAEANRPGLPSRNVQDTFVRYAEGELGFHSEAKGLFGEYEVPNLRPDYYRPVGTSGILLEVERGKTTQNNMDLLDFWKCHICTRAHYLFLLVPQELRQNEKQVRPIIVFPLVAKRLRAFFQAPNLTNVWGLFLFGY